MSDPADLDDDDAQPGVMRIPGVVPQLQRAIYGDPPPLTAEQQARVAKHLRRSEYRERLISVQQTAIAIAYVVIALLVCATGFELWRILHEVTP